MADLGIKSGLGDAFGAAKRVREKRQHQRAEKAERKAEKAERRAREKKVQQTKLGLAAERKERAQQELRQRATDEGRGPSFMEQARESFKRDPGDKLDKQRAKLEVARQKAEAAKERARLRAETMKLRRERSAARREAFEASGLGKAARKIGKEAKDFLDRGMLGPEAAERAQGGDAMIVGSGPQARVVPLGARRQPRFVQSQGEEGGAIDDYLGVESLEDILGADTIEEDLLGKRDPKSGRRDILGGVI